MNERDALEIARALRRSKPPFRNAEAFAQWQRTYHEVASAISLNLAIPEWERTRFFRRFMEIGAQS